MPEYRRAKIEGGTYFFTVNTHRRQPVLTEAPIREALREAVATAKQVHPFKVDAWVLLPDHLHCIWTLPESDSNFGLRWSFIKRFVSRRCENIPEHFASTTASREKRKESALWQRRFWEHWICDERDYARHVDYLHWNPVKHGHVARVSDWPYSTFHRFVNAGYYSQDWGGGGAALDGEAYGE